MSILLFQQFTITCQSTRSLVNHSSQSLNISRNLSRKMNRRKDMLKNNDSKSGEKTIKYKKGRGQELVNDAMRMEEPYEDDSVNALGNCTDSLPVNEESSTKKNKGQGQELVNDAMRMEEPYEDDSVNVLRSCTDGLPVNEDSSTKENSPGIWIYQCSTSVPRTIVKNSKMPILSDASSVVDATKIDECAKEEILECPTAKDASTYNMNLSRRGRCVIFNHEYFEKGNGDQRLGTKFDVKAIEETFGALGFEIIVYNDLLWFEVNEAIEELANDDYKDCACICIFILTHGIGGGKLSARDASYPFASIWTSFTADKCPTLFGKPKMFFIQACRGQYYDKAVRGRSETDYDDQSYTLPSQADFVFGYSTMEGFYSLRKPQEGTWYIQTLCDMINQHWKGYDLVKILTMTARKVGIEKSDKEQSSKEKKQMPVVTTTLIRDIFFAPPPQYRSLKKKVCVPKF